MGNPEAKLAGVYCMDCTNEQGLADEEHPLTDNDKETILYRFGIDLKNPSSQPDS